MKTIKQSVEAQIIVKKSVFIAHLCPFAEFKSKLAWLKEKHPKATHFVYAFRQLNENGQIVEDKSDDGEPKGTSALPCLNILRSFELVNIAVIVVRYFGGIKLGTGGLARAYSTALNTALNQATLMECKKSLNLSLNLSLYGRVKHYLAKNELEFETNFDDKEVFLCVKVNENEEKALLDFALSLGISP